MPQPSSDSPRVLAIVGPTAVGKSAVAHAVAVRLGGEIVVADPFQRYRGLEIAADSPSPDDRSQVVHHLVGDLDLHRSSSAGEYARRAHAAIDDILARGLVPVVSGGTGLYVRAALCELGFPEPPPPDVARAAADLAEHDPAAAMSRLRALDPAAAERVDAANPRRVAGALGRAMAGIRSRPPQELWTATMCHPTLVVGLTRPREMIDALIAARVDREIADGLVPEIEAAIDAPDGLSREAAQIIGVREVLAMRAGELDAADLPVRLAARTRRLARAQMTWLRKTDGIVQIDAGRPTAIIVEDVVELFRTTGTVTP